MTSRELAKLTEFTIGSTFRHPIATLFDGRMKPPGSSGIRQQDFALWSRGWASPLWRGSGSRRPAPYHRAFETALSGKYPLVKVSPRQARRCAEACGTGAKTDAVDVWPRERPWFEGPWLWILARTGAALALEPDESVR